MSSNIVPIDDEVVEVDNFTMDDLLDNVDYSFKNYTPSVDAINFFNFMRLVLGEEPENSNPTAHYFLIDTIFQNVNPFEYYDINTTIADKNFVAVCATREFSKSVLIGTMLPLYMAYYGELPNIGKVSFGFYVGASLKGGVKQRMRTIASVYEDSIFLQDKFERVKFTDEDVMFIRHPKLNKDGSISSKDSKVRNRKFHMVGFGVKGGPRGSGSGLDRPQFGILDDLIKTEVDSRSSTILSNISSILDSDIMYSLHGSKSFCIFIGTPFNQKDPLLKAITSGSWMPVVFPICEKISIDITKDDFSGVWEDRHSYERVLLKYKKSIRNGSKRSFLQEQMLRIADESSRIIPDNLIAYFSRKDVINNGESYNWVITTDLTTSAGEYSDLSAIGLWAVSSNSDLMLVDLFLQKAEILEQYDFIFDIVSKYKKFRGNILCGIEVDGSQRSHIFSIKEMMIKRKLHFTIAMQKGSSREGILRHSVKGDKFDYFLNVVPLFQAGKIMFAEELKNTKAFNELYAELSYITNEGIGSKRDDGIDMISQLSQINIIPPYSDDSAIQTVYNSRDDIWEERDMSHYMLENSSYVV